MKIIGYGICGKEADRYLENTLKEFKRLCDETIIVLNNATEKERTLIKQYGFHIKEDNREWGKEQHHIKEDLMEDVKKLNPDYCVCLDMDEIFEPSLTREILEKLFDKGDALYFYIVNLWDNGWRRKSSFFNIRAWKWSNDLKFENRPLHCGLAPIWCYHYGSYIPFIVYHYGLMKKSDRLAKVERYKEYDPKAKYRSKEYYDSLLDDSSEEIDYDFIKKSLEKEVGNPQKKKIYTKINRKFYYVKKGDKVIDVPDYLLKETLSRGFVLINKAGND